MENDSFPGNPPLPFPRFIFVHFHAVFRQNMVPSPSGNLGSATGRSVGKLCAVNPLGPPLSANIMAATRTVNYIGPLLFSEIGNRHCTTHDIQIDFSTKRFRFVLITARNRKVMFLHVSVIPFTGGGLPQCMLGYLPSWQGRTPVKETPPARQTPPAQCMLGDTVNKRAVSILLECNSCFKCFQYVLISFF